MGFLLFPIYGLLMGLRLAALRAAGAPLQRIVQLVSNSQHKELLFLASVVLERFFEPQSKTSF